MALGFFGKLRAGLARTTKALASGLGKIASLGRGAQRDALEQIEEILVSSDMGVQTAMRLREEIETRLKRNEIKGKDPAELVAPIREELKRLMPRRASQPEWAPQPPTVIMVVGVNGTGKTTSVGKLAKYLQDGGKRKVMLAAADTFRAAATEQLTIWSERAGVEIVQHGHHGVLLLLA